MKKAEGSRLNAEGENEAKSTSDVVPYRVSGRRSGGPGTQRSEVSSRRALVTSCATNETLSPRRARRPNVGFARALQKKG